MKKLNKKQITLIILSVVLVITASVSIAFINSDKVKTEGTTTTTEASSTTTTTETTTEEVATTESTTEEQTETTTKKKTESTTKKKSETTTKKPKPETTTKKQEPLTDHNGDPVVGEITMSPEELENAKYCNYCGRLKGDGSNGTCVASIKGRNCSRCDEWIPPHDGTSNTCHTCK